MEEEGKRSLADLGPYYLYKVCMVCVETQDQHGDLATGSAFHIGDGYLVTARHVVEDRSIVRLISEENKQAIIQIYDTILPDDDTVDLAILRTDFSLHHYMTRTNFHGFDNSTKIDHIKLGYHLDDWIGDSMVLMDVLVLGYPPIPTSDQPVLVGTRGEINAVIDPYIGPRHPLFIVSPIARGGFSGGPVIVGEGWLLGVVTSSLVRDGAAAETGYLSVLTIEPLLQLLADNEIYPASNGEWVREYSGTGGPMSHGEFRPVDRNDGPR